MAAVSAARAGVSPSSSPRLPSPPPIPEVQFGPKSPGMTDISKELSLDAPGKPDEGAARRIRPGTKAADMALGPPLVPLNQLDSPFQLQEHLKALYSHLTHTSESTHTIPISKETAFQLATPPQLNEHESVDRNLWLYELCRFLTQKANMVSIFLMNDNPPCSSQTCPEMRASEWQYLCAVHEPPKSCCAIDYCNHTLDWAANVLTSPKHFPSRLALGGEGGNVLQSMRQLTNIFRRVYRIFAHAWFQHRDVFWSVEATYGLYILFKVVCDEYHLIPEDSYTIPPEAEGLPDTPEDRSNTSTSEAVSRMQILRKDNPNSQDDNTSAAPSDAPTTTTISTGATTRRHKHTPSTGSHVGTIAEGHEEDEDHTASFAPTEPSSTESEPTDSNTQKTDPSPDRQLPKLDIGATVPKYEARAPEDPTPTATAEDVDPLSATKTEVRESSPEEIQTPITARHDEGIDEDRVMSPSGGSIRTGGPDVLKAILGHIDDLDDEDIQLGSPITQGRTSPEKSTSPSKKEEAEASRIKVEVEETTDDDDDAEQEQSAEQADQAQEKKDE
ncbi:Mob1/phocein [Exophiala viscosa]|uniref:Mob1/phocein n=1 Tax=Exophiala viscosa TaxID=2486360 RepID=A0AAN6IIV9_9EURO|nr:Mob1/phocein [Exophiala viscosa]KAI1628261.1 Mob1/phocein [Exophiala viscosa]